MARASYSGDFVHGLPKGKVEPYRLWFEYLKFALADPNSAVEREFYAPWGNVEDAEFSSWWSGNWRRLFAVPANVTIMEDAALVAEVVADPDTLVVVIRRSGTETQRLDDVRKLIRKRFGYARKQSAAKPAFVVTAKRNVHYPALRSMLRFLLLYREKRNLEDAAVAYIDWVNAWNEKVDGTMREPSHVPKTLQRFAEEVKKHREEVRLRGRAKQSPAYNNAKNDVRKFLQQGEKVVKNVAKGLFPGFY